MTEQSPPYGKPARSKPLPPEVHTFRVPIPTPAGWTVDRTVRLTPVGDLFRVEIVETKR